MFTSYSVSRQEWVDKEGVGPLLSDWIHLRIIVTELSHPVRTNRIVRSSLTQAVVTENMAVRHRNRRTQSDRWSSWSSWCWGKTEIVCWWILSKVLSWPPTTCGPGLHSEEGLHQDLWPDLLVGWEVALLLRWTSAMMDECHTFRKMREGVETELVVFYLM